MDIDDLVSMGFMPKPKETIDDYLKNGKIWYDSTTELRGELDKDIEGTLKKLKVGYSEGFVPQLPGELHEVPLRIKCIGVTEPYFPVVNMVPSQYGLNLTITYGRIAEAINVDGCAMNVRYQKNRLPVAFVKDGEESTEAHEDLHCIRRRLGSKFSSKDYLFDEKIAYESGVRRKIIGTYLEDKKAKEKKQSVGFDAIIGGTHIVSGVLVNPGIIFGAIPWFIIAGYTVYSSHNIKKVGRTIDERIDKVVNEVGRNRTLALASRMTREEFMDISGLDDIYDAIDLKIDESKEEYRWRWELIKDNLNRGCR